MYTLYIPDVQPFFVSLHTPLSGLKYYRRPAVHAVLLGHPLPASWRVCAGPAAAGGDRSTARGSGRCSCHRAGNGRGGRESGFSVLCRSAAARWFPARMSHAAARCGYPRRRYEAGNRAVQDVATW